MAGVPVAEVVVVGAETVVLVLLAFLVGFLVGRFAR